MSQIRRVAAPIRGGGEFVERNRGPHNNTMFDKGARYGNSVDGTFSLQQTHCNTHCNTHCSTCRRLLYHWGCVQGPCLAVRTATHTATHTATNTTTHTTTHIASHPATHVFIQGPCLAISTAESPRCSVEMRASARARTHAHANTHMYTHAYKHAYMHAYTPHTRTHAPIQIHTYTGTMHA
jgi:hypothetical protein